MSVGHGGLLLIGWLLALPTLPESRRVRLTTRWTIVVFLNTVNNGWLSDVPADADNDGIIGLSGAIRQPIESTLGLLGYPAVQRDIILI